jgi:hypothetical protein
MTIVSHIIYPIVAAQSANIYRVHSGKPSLFNWKQLLIIGLCGGLPDILSPHVRLADRYESFAHSLWFFLVAIFLSAMLSIKLHKYQKLICFCLGAITLHLVGDMIAGGINIFAPFGVMIIGKYYILPRYWISLDLIGILFLLAIFTL